MNKKRNILCTLSTILNLIALLLLVLPIAGASMVAFAFVISSLTDQGYVIAIPIYVLCFCILLMIIFGFIIMSKNKHQNNAKALKVANIVLSFVALVLSVWFFVSMLTENNFVVSLIVSTISSLLTIIFTIIDISISKKLQLQKQQSTLNDTVPYTTSYKE